MNEVEAGCTSWGLLFWVALMRCGEDETIATRWKSVLYVAVAYQAKRSDLMGISLIFAELAGRFLIWERVLKEWTMTESAVVNRWMLQGQTSGEVTSKHR